MGSRSKIDLAYIAGFLDGDGSLMLQIKKRKDTKQGWRFMCTICIYQDSRHSKPLEWMREIFGIGYLSHRKDGISELRVNGYKQVGVILKGLLPYIRFKEIQANALYEACDILSSKTQKHLTEKDLRRLVTLILKIQGANYATRSKKSEEELLSILGLTP